MQPIRVGIRGIGLLGSRLALAIRHAPDLRLTVGVVVPDRTLEALVARCGILSGYPEEALPEQLYVSVPSHLGRESAVVAKWNTRQSVVQFQGASQLSWKKECDVIVDTAWPAGKEAVEKQYRHFEGPILVQDGAAPDGRLIVPPGLAPEREEDGKFLRMGDCMLSRIVPLLWPLQKQCASVRLSLLMQYDGREPDYTIPERIDAWYLRDDLREKLTRDLGALYPRLEVEVASVVQIPALLHYAVTCELKMHQVVAHEQVLAAWQEMPRVRVLPAAVISTYDLNLARSFDERIPPITVLASSVEPRPGVPSRYVRFVAALYYRSAAVLPNVDAIRMLTRGLHPLEAMRQTDRDMGFVV